MPLVFIHGVNNRKDAQYDEREQMRAQYFRTIALAGVAADPSKVTIRSPYWGQHGARLAWASASLPLPDNEAFGGDDEVFGAIWSELAPDVLAPADQLLLTLARQDLERAVDCLWAAAMHTAPTPGDAAAPLAAAAAKALACARAHPQPAWLDEVGNDQEFVERLTIEVDDWTPPGAGVAGTQAPEAFGANFGAAWNRLKSAALRLKDAAKNAVGAGIQKATSAAAALGQAAAGAVINPVVRKARPGLHQQASMFLGDIFQYLDQRSKPKADGADILGTVLSDLDAADAARPPGDDQLIIVAHSMGGNIAFDVLSRVRPQLVCDVLVTVGSQVALFAELGLFPAVPIDWTVADDPGRPKATTPANIKRWLNVFDPADVLGYAAAGVFDRAEDYALDNNVTALTAHGMYFEKPRFYERLRARMLGGKEGP